MNAVLLKCAQPSKFRFGKAGLDVNSALSTTDHLLHSDTLFSAIINTAAKIYPTAGSPSVTEIIDWFESGIVKISSAFYCLKADSGDMLYFLPKPCCHDVVRSENAAQTSERKRTKRVKFISKRVWELGILPNQWLIWNGKEVTDSTDNKAFIIDGKFVVTSDEYKLFFANEKYHKIYDDQIRPRVTDQVRRPENNYYFQSELFLPKHSGFETHLYFLMEASEEVQPVLKLLFEVLADTGIGGRVSLGCGQLEKIIFQQTDFRFNIAESHETLNSTISLVSPSATEAAGLKYYELTTRGGRRVLGGYEAENEATTTNVPNILKRVKMLQEGAIVATNTNGNIQDISPIEDQRQYLRNGKAFTIPIHKAILNNE